MNRGGQPIINQRRGLHYDVVSGVVYNLDFPDGGQRIRGLAYEGRIVQPTDSFTMAVNSYGRRAARLLDAGERAVVYDRGKTFASCWWMKSPRPHDQATAYLRPSWRSSPIPPARGAGRIRTGAAASALGTDAPAGAHDERPPWTARVARLDCHRPAGRRVAR